MEYWGRVPPCVCKYSTQCNAMLDIDVSQKPHKMPRERSHGAHFRSQEDAEAHCTAPYRAPELFEVASRCAIDERVDVWSLGCLLCASASALGFSQVMEGRGYPHHDSSPSAIIHRVFDYTLSCFERWVSFRCGVVDGGRSPNPVLHRRYFMLYNVSPFERVLGEAGGSLMLAVINGSYTYPGGDERPQCVRDLIAYCLELDALLRPCITDVMVRANVALQTVQQQPLRSLER